MSAHSAARTQSSVKLSESGTARGATRALLGVPTLSRKYRSRGEEEENMGREMSNVLIRVNMTRTPAAAATRSTIRRLREIAEV